jgi:hypothetical protein
MAKLEVVERAITGVIRMLPSALSEGANSRRQLQLQMAACLGANLRYSSMTHDIGLRLVGISTSLSRFRWSDALAVFHAVCNRVERFYFLCLLRVVPVILTGFSGSNETWPTEKYDKLLIDSKSANKIVMFMVDERNKNRSVSNEIAMKDIPIHFYFISDSHMG